MNESRGAISERAKTALNVLAVNAISAAQAANANPQQVDAARISRALDAIEARVGEARRELGGASNEHKWGRGVEADER
jgi:hypothetical protein